ncbi:MAG: enoyl-CoA hydratase/isomerase family protein [Oleispira sp.]|nr:enoyl-CoA hydratase/isomerase family protein [Oleispira sp.]
MNDLNLQPKDTKFIITRITDNVLTVMMNQPDKLNGWTEGMMNAFKAAFNKANTNDSVKAIIFTGVGQYFSAGVNLGGTFKAMHPKKMHQFIVEHNQILFETFLDCKKPILVAVNGPAIGASVTSATLCDGIIASENATFLTPFSALGITPEGCSSIHFERIMGKENAQRMLGAEGWKPTADEALEAGLVQWVAPKEQLLEKAQSIAKEWADKGIKRSFLGGSQLEELKQVNARESVELADAFFSSDFLRGQMKFLWSKNKKAPASVFFLLLALKPVWSRML